MTIDADPAAIARGAMDKSIPVSNDTPKEWPDSLDDCPCPYCDVPPAVIS